ncbi:MAG TPA: ubiquitin-like small modifier protein 1 [Candidatus Limnocylindria bacterium]|nr:ubiquitin-like small modifier protein 1 [Candidatus Limnocylindria bacterium]
MSAVRIPPVLRTATGGQKQVQVAGDTVGEVLSGLASAYPSLATQVLTPDGDINRYVNVYLNDTDVRHLQALSTPVGERDTLLLLPAMAGGAGGAGPIACAGGCATAGPCSPASDTCACPKRASAG